MHGALDCFATLAMTKRGQSPQAAALRPFTQLITGLTG